MLQFDGNGLKLPEGWTEEQIASATKAFDNAMKAYEILSAMNTIDDLFNAPFGYNTEIDWWDLRTIIAICHVKKAEREERMLKEYLCRGGFVYTIYTDKSESEFPATMALEDLPKDNVSRCFELDSDSHPDHVSVTIILTNPSENAKRIYKQENMTWDDIVWLLHKEWPAK